uniref:EF-hand domain-containing protein n=1 Tax=Macrostomum lignano TaxID=282301 RepID=A0A1I8FMU7_9PLAT
QQQLWDIFQRIDKDRSGSINCVVANCLSNGTWTPFNPETVRLMISMFDRNQSASISIHFQQLWRYITDWQNTFRTYDRATTNRHELKPLLTTFGYRYPIRLHHNLLIRKFDRRTGRATIFSTIFICKLLACSLHCCITPAFAQKDVQRNGGLLSTI